MRKRTKLREKLTYANVMVTILAFVVLGGGALAATKLPKNSVGTRQLKKNSVTAKKIKKNAVTKGKIRKNAVTGAKVKKKSLTGQDINLNKLGTVPKANVANTANALAPLEATHLVGAPGEPAFEGGSGNLEGMGATAQPVGFYKDHDGIVHLQGLAQVGTGAPFPKIFTLPPGYRPANNTVLEQIVLCLPLPKPCVKDSGEDEETYSPLIVAGSNLNLEGVPLSGGVISGPDRIVSLDGIDFRAES